MPDARAFSKHRFIPSMAQKRLRAVGRVWANAFADTVKSGLETFRRKGRKMERPEGDTQGGGDADGRRAADRQIFDGR